MEQKTKGFIGIGLLCIISIIIGVIANIIFSFTFSAYFVICTLTLLWCSFIKDKAKLIIPWTITAVASVLITLNYLHPNISVYSNADYHVLVMQGVDKKDSVLLVGKNKTQSFFDKKNYEGFASITPKNSDSQNCILHYNILSEPIFAKVDDSRTGRLINKGQLPSFHDKITLQNDSIICNISIRTIKEDKKDSTKVVVSFNHLSNNTQKKYEPSFKLPIQIGYNLYDILHSSTSYEETGEEELLNTLHEVFLVRNHEDKEQDVFYMTYPQSLKDVKLFCDGKEFIASNALETEELDKDTYYYIGIGSQATRPLKAVYSDGCIRLRYQFPYINNFPGLADDAEAENRQKVIAVTSKTASLLKTNVNEAFYYPLFENENNEYNFNGNINYMIDDSQTPFKAILNDNSINTIQLLNTLTAKNGAVWHFNVCNLRQSSPITGEDNIWVKDITILFLVFGILFLTFLYSMIFTKGHTSKVVMIASLFAIPFFVIRIYLLWRIAVFPPVTDITLNEFLRYTMKLPNLLENPILITIGLWILMPVTALSLWICIKYLPNFELRKLWKKIVYSIFLFLPIAIVLITKFAHISIVGLNILVPVSFFILNEYIIARGLPVGYRIANALFTLAALFIGDPGYAIMFFIFECIYYSIILYSFLKYRYYDHTAGKAAGFPLFTVLVFLVIVMVIFLPYCVWTAYNQEDSFLGFISTSRLFFILLPLIMGFILLLVTWLWKRYDFKWKGAIAIFVWLTFVVSTATIGYDYFQTNNLHFKYRAIIHTQTVGRIMQNESYNHSNSQRLLNAAQNQWFLQYHINKGEKRVTDDGIMSLLPHFKKGVTWNTQISDVILSRYVIGELSWLVPITMILLSLVLLWRTFQNENNSPAGRTLTFAIALLFVVQSTFEWMAVTNRTVFFGQDFPFLSQNARFTLIMFAMWIAAFVVFACYHPKDEDNSELKEGLKSFTKRGPQTTFFLIFIVIALIVYFCGNNYGELYANNKVQGDKMNAEEFNISTAMATSKDELAGINSLLSQYPARGHQLVNEEDISSLVKDIEEKIHLSEHVNKLKEEGLINDFTYSLYQAFTNNLKRKNSNGNIIHLRHQDLNTFELALNNAYFSLQSPEFDKKAWKGNIYSEISATNDSSALMLTKLPGLIVYSIPQSWLPKNVDLAIVDSRMKDGHIGENYKVILHREMKDYTASTAVFQISPENFLELRDTKSKESLTYQYGRDEQDILVKNIVINGKRRFFYPLKEKCLWLRDFSNLVAYSKQGTGSRDMVFVTLDSKLTQHISETLKQTGHECSVVAIDGLGNVRLMADNKLSGSIDPNDETLIEELATQSYMNPNSMRDENLFGNLNLCYMRPGPGSSLKPITYAAVTSQSQDINWAGLELMSPKVIQNKEVAQSDDKYYYIKKFGPKYTYSDQRPFKSIASDENGDGQWIDNEFYLSQSSNYYNALITYLGHYESLANAKDEIFVISKDINDFPRFRIEQNGQIYTFRNAPTATSEQILFDGLTKNFHMPTFIGWVDSLRYEFINTNLYKENNLENKAKVSSRFAWAFPQASTIYNYEMEDSQLTPAERLRQYTLGASPVKVTPMKMAEMYGKLYSLHPDFHASVMPRKSKFKDPWLGRNGNTQKKHLEFYQNNLYRGMFSCIQKGTAKELNTLKGYHLYAKTGTLSLGNKTHDDRMLAVIICNHDITSDKIKSLDDNKFMVVYFRFKQLTLEKKVYWNMINNVLENIVNSNSFKKYMR